MSEMKLETKVVDGQPQSNCHVNMTFNFLVGGLAIAAALFIGYSIYAYWWK